VADYTFGNATSAQTSGASMLTSLTPALPTGTAAGDVLFLVVSGQVSVSPDWSVPSGWTEIGARVTGDQGTGTVRYAALRLWVKTAGASESAPTVSLTTSVGTGAARNWQTLLLRFVPSSSSVTFDLVGACDDYSQATSFTGNSKSVDRAATTVTLIASVSNLGSLTASSSQGFTREAVLTNYPATAWFDKDTTAGSVSLPDFATPTYSYIAKVFAFDRTVAGDQWGMNVVRW
jgi:hypothetical protein